MRAFILFISLTCFVASSPCNNRYVTTYLKQPLYKFSTNILSRVTEETGGHFVFSPVFSWMQLLNLAEGAEGNTLTELRQATGKFWNSCMRRRLRLLLNGENEESNIKSKSLVIVDKFLRVNRPFKKRLESQKNVKVELLDFQNADASSDKANDILADATQGDVTNAVVPDDFNNTMLLLNDAVSFTNAWLKPFNPAYTQTEKFYHDKDPVGEVKMMSLTEHFNYTRIHKIGAEILELPCIDENHSMLIFLPMKNERIYDLFYKLKHIRLATIFNLFKKNAVPPLVNVKLPRFRIETEVANLPELINDMGVSRIFYLSQAELKGISRYPISVSSMKQTAHIKVTEEGVNAGADSSILKAAAVNFEANRPFGFMLVQKSTEIPLFAGIYMQPSVY